MSDETADLATERIPLKRPRDSFFLDAYIGMTAVVCGYLFSVYWYNHRLAFLLAVFAAAALSYFLRTGRACATPLWTAILLFCGATPPALLPVYNHASHGLMMGILALVVLASGIALGIFLRALATARKFTILALVAIPSLAAMILMLFGFGPIWFDRLDHPFVDRPLPELALSTFGGQPIDPASWGGHVVVLSFWATWCGPCKAELPELARLQEHYKDNPRVLVMAVDVGLSGEDNAEKAHAYLQEHHLALNEAVWTSKKEALREIQKNYDANAGIPFLLVIDANQRVRMFQSGDPGLFVWKTTKIVDSVLKD